MIRRSPSGAIATGVLAAVLAAAPAPAAPPLNDAPAGAFDFAPFPAANGTPRELQGIAELAEASADPGVPRCLGSSSFDRTVWFRLPEQPQAVELSFEASGRRIDVLDLAAFVQDEVPPQPPAAPDQPPPPPPPRGAPVTAEPQACSGEGAGGSADAYEPTAAVNLIVPPRHPVLVQVGRRGPRRSADDERAVVNAAVRAARAQITPRGDRAGSATPRLRGTGVNLVPLGGATLTAEDPAQPPCPSAASVWRRLVPGSTGSRLVSVSGGGATTLTAFAGSRPSGDNVLDCVNRSGSGTLDLKVPVRRNRTVWIRVGTERTLGDEDADIRVRKGEDVTVIDGGPGGFDPTPGGPGGGLPAVCDTADMTRSRITGPRLKGKAGAYNRFTRVPVVMRVKGEPVCDAELRLIGPGGAIYAKGLERRLRPGKRPVRLPRLRTFKPGRYKLEVQGVTPRGEREKVRGRVKGRLRK